MLVDDGSPDRCGVICDQYAQSDSRIRVFHIPNGGVAKARQLGVENSQGEYIIFVDPDDWLPQDSVETLYSNMSDEVDIVMGGYEAVLNSGSIKVCPQPRIIDKDSYIELLLSDKVSCNLWARLYRRSLFTDSSFPILKKTQDFLTNLDISPSVRSVIVINAVVYYYYQRSSSTSYTYPMKLDIAQEICLSAKRILIQKGIFEKYEKPYHRYELLRLFEIIRKGGSVDVKSKFVKSVCESNAGLQNSLIERYLFMSLRIQRLQYIFISAKKIQQRCQGKA